MTSQGAGFVALHQAAATNHVHRRYGRELSLHSFSALSSIPIVPKSAIQLNEEPDSDNAGSL
jgi:hypothetical protein